MTKGFADVTVTTADVWHTIGRRGETASFWGVVEAVEASDGNDGEGLAFVGREAGAGVFPSCGRREVTASFEGAGEGEFPSWGRQDGRSQHKSVSTRSWDSGVEHPPCSHAKKSTRGKNRNTCCLGFNKRLQDLLKEMLIVTVVDFFSRQNKYRYESPILGLWHHHTIDFEKRLSSTI